MKDIAIIVLNYNSLPDCRKCISFLMRQEGVNFEIVVVDNCSPREGEQGLLQQFCQEQGCTFIPVEENRGYNAGNNVGLRYATEKGYKYALIVNPDMEFPQTDYVKRMISIMEKDSEVVVVGSDIRDVKGGCQNPMDFVPFWDEFLYPLKIKNNSSKEGGVSRNGYCNMVSGACLAVRMDFIKEINFFEDKVFLYCEEVILAYQVKQRERKIYYLADAMAIHRHIKSEKGNPYKRLISLLNSRDYKNKYYSDYNRIQILFLYLSNCVKRFFLNLKIRFS